MICGIEIHQRLSGRKLFCSCTPPGAGAAEGGKTAKFSRKLHLVASELGELDAAAKLEALRDRSFHYIAPVDSCCLVEMDEEPPHAINPEALAAALTICDLLSSRPVDRLYVMRKNVIDGSNTSGFQRTALLATGGKVASKAGSVGIIAVCIEEESAAMLEGADSHAAYALDRLGIPLVEIATEPTLKTGQEAQDAAEAIGALLRKTGLVARGLGTIRQDLNVSIPGGARVEIKGVQDLSMISKTVETEARRQQEILKISSEAKARLGARSIARTFYDVTETVRDSKSPMVSKMLKPGSKAFALALPGFAGLLGREVSPNRRFGTELADYARACGVRGLIHSDEDMGKYGISDDALSELKVALSLSDQDAFALVVSDPARAQAALSAIAARASVFAVPEETRKANPDGTSSYMRPLPGKARLYPETDHEPVAITKGMLASAKQNAREISQMESEKGRMLSSINAELAAQLSSVRGLISHDAAFKPLAQTPELSVFAAAAEDGMDQGFAASVLTNTLKGLRREGEDTLSLNEPRLLSALRAHKGGVFTKAAMADILRLMCKGKSTTPVAAAKELGLERISGAALKELAAQIPDFSQLMAKYRLQVDASEAAALYGKGK